MRSSPRTPPTRARLGGTAAVLAGLLLRSGGLFPQPRHLRIHRCPRVRAKRGLPGFVTRGAVGPSRPTTGRYTNVLRELSRSRGVRVRLLRSRAGYSLGVGIGRNAYSLEVGIGRNGDNVFLVVGAVV